MFRQAIFAAASASLAFSAPAQAQAARIQQLAVPPVAMKDRVHVKVKTNTSNCPANLEDVQVKPGEELRVTNAYGVTIVKNSRGYCHREDSNVSNEPTMEELRQKNCDQLAQHAGAKLMGVARLTGTCPKR